MGKRAVSTKKSRDLVEVFRIDESLHGQGAFTEILVEAQTREVIEVEQRSEEVRGDLIELVETVQRGCAEDAMKADHGSGDAAQSTDGGDDVVPPALRRCEP